jgi:ABC-type antimicrobial peptide transport system permease subunit
MVRAKEGIAAATLADPARRAIARIDRGLAAYQVRTEEEVRREVLARERYGSMLVAILAGLGTLIALLGAYGVANYRIERRRGEIGVRLALGARRAQIVRGSLGQGLRPVAAGIAAGTLLAIGQAALLRRLVFDLPSFSPLAALAIAAGLTVAAAAGLLVPAWRAATIDPSRTLRSV